MIGDRVPSGDRFPFVSQVGELCGVLSQMVKHNRGDTCSGVTAKTAKTALVVFESK